MYSSGVLFQQQPRERVPSTAYCTLHSSANSGSQTFQVHILVWERENKQQPRPSSIFPPQSLPYYYCIWTPNMMRYKPSPSPFYCRTMKQIRWFRFQLFQLIYCHGLHIPFPSPPIKKLLNAYQETRRSVKLLL